MIIIPADFLWWVFAVFMGVAAYRCAEVVMRAFLATTSQWIDDWLYWRAKKRERDHGRT